MQTNELGESVPGDVTQLLKRLDSAGGATKDPDAFRALIALVYEDLKKRARLQDPLGKTKGEWTVSDLVHELAATYQASEGMTWDFPARRNFFNSAARAMHNLLIDYHREQNAAARGGGVIHEELNESYSRDVDAWCAPETQYDFEQLVKLSALPQEAMNALEQQYPDAAEVWRLSLYMTEPEIADTTGCLQREVKSLKDKGRTFLKHWGRNHSDPRQ